MSFKPDDLRIFRLKRTVTLASYVLQSIAHGISFYIFPPILAGYLKNIDSDNIGLYEGIIFALEPIVGSLAAVTLGRVCDKTQKAKLLLILLQVSQVIGNLLYSIRLSEWTILIGKVFCGLGEEAFFSIATGELATCYYGRAEAWALLLLTMGFAIGMAIGPLFNFLFCYTEFSIGILLYNKYNTPGLFIAILHFVMALVCWAGIYDMSALSVKYQLLTSDKHGTLALTGSDTESEYEPEVKSINGHAIEAGSGSTIDITIALFKKRPIGALMLMSFLFMTLTMTSMTLIPLAGLHRLHLSTNDIVVAFSMAGVMSVIGNFIVYTLPCSFRMGHILLLSIIFLLFQIACIIFVSLDIAELQTARCMFFVWSTLHGLTFIFCDLICRTMVAVSTPRGHRSLAEGWRQVAVCTGYFVGGLLAGALFKVPILLGLIMLLIVLITFLIFIFETQNIMNL